MAQTALLLLLAATLLPAQPARFGLPACSPSRQELADHAFFLLCHDPALKVSRWVAYELLPPHLNHPTAPRPSRFRPDPQLAATLLPAQPARFGLPACSPSHQELADRSFF
ncbi:MAG: hypothetical protein SFV54_09650, partial [Bryobacteraceae bacterium]|nr:hypothetical protein [Bryobacteraceae bacterium]